MNEADKEIQRREVVFRVLDDLKSKGERINADKLARLAKMGKQTVLPHYNEWRFLDDAEKDVDEELPVDLVRVLKRGLIQWKHQSTQEQRLFEDKANEEIDELQQIVSQLTEERVALNHQIDQLQSDAHAMADELKSVKHSSDQKERSLISATEQLKAETKKTESLENTLKELKSDHNSALTALEKKLDNQYQGQINHWIKMVDNERRLRSDIESQLQQQRDSSLSVEKERNDIQYRLEAKSRAHLDACEERNQFKESVKGSKPIVESMGELSLLLNQPVETLLSRVRSLLQTEQEAAIQKQRLTESLEKQKSLTRHVETHKNIEFELVKLKGYCEALEKTQSTGTSTSTTATNEPDTL